MFLSKKIIVPQGSKQRFLKFDSLKEHKDIIVEKREDEINMLLKYAKQAVEYNNYTKAIIYFEDAAKLGSEEAAYNLAIFYIQGKGTTKDLFKAHYYTLPYRPTNGQQTQASILSDMIASPPCALCAENKKITFSLHIPKNNYNFAVAIE